MKLKLYTQDPQALMTTLSLIVPSRKFVTLKFTPEVLYLVLTNEGSITQEPQIYCKFKTASLFNQIQIESLKDDTILLEINAELLLQALRQYDKANADGLNIRLQKKDSESISFDNGRAASLALFYSHVNSNSNTVNNTFKIPVNILKTSVDVNGPDLSRIDLFTYLPNEFVTTYKRLDKFRKSTTNENLSIKCSRRNGGFLGFLLEEEGKYRVTISWNEGLDVRKPSQYGLQTMDLVFLDLFVSRPDDETVDNNDTTEDKTITVKLKDWKLASKIVANCKTVVFLMSQDEACVLHCLLDDSNDVEILYYINALRVRTIIEE